MAAVKGTTGRGWSIAQPRVRAKSSSVCIKPGTWNLVPSFCGPRHGFKQDQLCHPSFRQLQAKIKAENEEVQELLRPLSNRDNGIMKEIESLLAQTNTEELRRRELKHKRWTEHVWFPVQTRVEKHAASWYFMDAMRHQIMHSHYLLHCQSKIRTSGPREMRQLSLQLKRKIREKRLTTAGPAGSKPASSKTLERPQTGCCLTSSLISQANRRLQAL
ncbi:protein FAM228A [Poecilia latipinna]|uniref:protein FAM228A n=1 Tax=Poecilia latipinna TaxID=48699 RepID=UPI00072D99E9|nr:PREDICTED: protein FAM228A-like [Poecilia latipinna]